MYKYATLFLAATWVMIAGGCGEKSADYGDLKLTTLTGRITLDGQPLADARLKFMKADNESVFEYAITDSNGKYSARFNSEKEGISPGPKKVSISTGRPIFEDDEVQEERIPSQYNVATTLELTIADGGNTKDFDLVSNGEIIQPEELEED